jgi:four helix bundle protein
MLPPTSPRGSKPFNLRERTAIFAREIVGAAQFLHRRSPIGRELSIQILKAGTSVGSNVEEADGASSRKDFVAKMRIALKEAKETRFRLKTCRASNLLDRRFDGLIDESDQLVRIIATIVHNTIRGGVDDDHTRDSGP